MVKLGLKAKEKNILFNGYFKNEEMTSKALTNGWYHTGDLLKQDNSGNYFFVPLLAAMGSSMCPQKHRCSLGFHSMCQFVSLHFSIAENLQW